MYRNEVNNIPKNLKSLLKIDAKKQITNKQNLEITLAVL